MLTQLDEHGNPVVMSIFSEMDMTNAPRDPVTGEVIFLVRKRCAPRQGAASELKVLGGTVSQEMIDLLG